ncbi:calcium-binding protein [Muricoccus radiodurans]|uniref:calcium-binding protein n=1 Tax=Muricoccus radiodurans TaxID=2231721 RepID=UPI003CEBE1E3
MTSKPIPLDPAALDAVTGGAVTIGGSGADRIVGTGGADLLLGNGGDDAIAGGAGNDQIEGGGGRDVLQGDAGDDRLSGGTGDRVGDIAFGGDGNDTYTWSPGDGNDSFRGMAGQDTLSLPTLSLGQLQSALQVSGTGLHMQVSGNVVSFTNASGQPASFGGTINLGGETLTFSEIERIQVR